MTRDLTGPTSTELRARVLEQTSAPTSPFGDPIALVEDWRIAADEIEASP
jgi:hypothetical protein